MKPYSYKANLLSSWSTPTDAVLADYTVQNTLSSGWKFQGFAAGGEPQVVDFSTLQSSVSGGEELIHSQTNLRWKRQLPQ